MVNKNTRPTMGTHCVLAVEPDGQFFGGKTLGLDSDIATTLLASQVPDANPFLGFSIEIPLGVSNEESGFGQTHVLVYSAKRRPKPSEFLRIRVKFPRGSIHIAVEELGQDRRALFAFRGNMSQVQVRLQPGSQVDVEGFGIPFENPGHPAQEWLKHPALAPVVGDKTLLDLFQQDSFTFIARAPYDVLQEKWSLTNLAGEFVYPYGNEHHWDINSYLDQLHHVKGPQFAPAWSYDDDNSHLTAVTQSQVQDVMWLYAEALEISNERRLAYFVSKPPAPNESAKYFVIVKMGPEFWHRFRDNWHHLTGRYRLSLLMHDVPGELPRAWPASVQNPPEHINALSQHPVSVNDLVLEVTKSLSPRNRVSLGFNLRLHEIKAKVDAICKFHPDAISTNEFAGDQDLVAPESHHTKLMMSLHRDLMRGQGFWRTMIHGVSGAMGQAALDDNEAKRMCLEALPCVNLLKGPNEEWISALMMQVPGPDRTRFRRYMSERPLGLGLITSLAELFSTNALSAATLGMAASLGKVFGSGPTHAAVDDFSEALYTISYHVTEAYNVGKEAGNRSRRALVVRAFELDYEFVAFDKLLRDPDLRSDATPYNLWEVKSEWKFHLSPSYWLLMCFGSSPPRPLHDDDSQALHNLRDFIVGRQDLARLRDLVAKNITWEEYVNGRMVGRDELMKLLKHVIMEADILCALPTQAANEETLAIWRMEHARGIAIDKAGSIARPDLYSVWGNTLLPCLLAGYEENKGPFG
ncbi:hypothetical protein NM208_g3330 [Fusarium decemcellulare]|uniref:Uncharacterized protein n=2 Tax=Fusarium decemcellulare TaxID=57161 RepID=A0ACC1SPZ3_9HYPO|nr:hypothetical protein NM208_g9110 [Fusarium decemcellulare]KAJ3543903.1 hypothetical protein NM208_g3330 [Fusarium decemcellulare]